jgi:hypothetical protein
MKILEYKTWRLDQHWISLENVIWNLKKVNTNEVTNKKYEHEIPRLKDMKIRN